MSAVRRHAMDEDMASRPWWPTLERQRVVASDGTGLHCEMVGDGERILLLANGLGGRLYSWLPLIDALWQRYRIITWDYRGLFESDNPPSPRQLTMAHHVEDAYAVMRSQGVDRAVMVGWSMGVQVSLDCAASRPERLAGLILLNGTHGHVFSSGFQPLVSVPWLPRRLHHLVEFLRRHDELTTVLALSARLTELPAAMLLSVTAGRRGLALRPFLRRYYDDVLGGESFANYLRLFQELDAHSVYHLLPTIETPALVISGSLDALTPAYQSTEMVRRMPNAQALRLWRASHFAMVERPEVVVPAMERFLAERVDW